MGISKASAVALLAAPAALKPTSCGELSRLANDPSFARSWRPSLDCILDPPETCAGVEPVDREGADTGAGPQSRLLPMKKGRGAHMKRTIPAQRAHHPTYCFARSRYGNRRKLYGPVPATASASREMTPFSAHDRPRPVLRRGRKFT